MKTVINVDVVNVETLTKVGFEVTLCSSTQSNMATNQAHLTHQDNRSSRH